MARYRVRRNVWDNWYGYKGRKRVAAFGNTPYETAEEAAQRWLKEREAEEVKEKQRLLEPKPESVPESKPFTRMSLQALRWAAQKAQASIPREQRDASMIATLTEVDEALEALQHILGSSHHMKLRGNMVVFK